MSGFTVELDTVAGAASALRESLSVVGEWDSRRSEFAGAGDQAGHASMTDAIGQFCEEWTYGFGKLAEGVESLAAALEQAVAVYASTEQAIVDAAGGG